MKIYTRKGDSGTTMLFGGTRLTKDNIRIEAYGTVDELNSFLGWLADKEPEFADQIHRIQSTLFDLGSWLATDPSKRDKLQLPRFDESEITLLEQWIDQMESELPQLKSFILPGGDESASLAHVCRTVCRRAERRVVAALKDDDLPVPAISYLNRLSDYLFVLARYILFKKGKQEKPWVPRK